MPNIKSAKKRVRVTRKKTLRNKHVKTMVKTAIKKFELALQNEDVETAREELKNATKTIDKAVSKGVIHKNNAARKKSRLTAKFNNIAS
ncbi:30S ribosomal protein S20 [Natranaerobius thermophilus]|uniref:Small ribosomal subunit protein bS20 n=1 Tax=Natranaerobius thermophilus (strain ATCC BAA-1301 / DSM 18059 / JW/NM-WN-LF) TaxID=457570 RepID=RS20_NATTJ|nr:30S ribosomal protein S20 [Natranaerobius thermophilus]B2A1L9.1 RecName: Full=Small ribosomal subunit protein bS20; AltName: Full=30S ribosomal protein S20 [Natranaerobius thermophilus JW/NM-WN-LF]ACB84759.1 SSU ribosomal protein S20P [Natranaerobius thermophilus JW/NM-WN-LF]